MGLLCPPVSSARFLYRASARFCTGPAYSRSGRCPTLRGLPPLRSLGLRPLVRGRGGSCFLCGSGVLRCVAPPFFVSGVGAGVGPCVFGCRRALVSSLALFGGLPLDPDYAVPDAENKKILRGEKKRPLERTFCCAEKSVQIIWRWTGGRGEGRCRFWRFWLISSFFWRNCI